MVHERMIRSALAGALPNLSFAKQFSPIPVCKKAATIPSVIGCYLGERRRRGCMTQRKPTCDCSGVPSPVSTSDVGPVFCTKKGLRSTFFLCFLLLTCRAAKVFSLCCTITWQTEHHISSPLPSKTPGNWNRRIQTYLNEIVCKGPVGHGLWQLTGLHVSMFFLPSPVEQLVQKNGHLKT